MASTKLLYQNGNNLLNSDCTKKQPPYQTVSSTKPMTNGLSTSKESSRTIARGADEQYDSNSIKTTGSSKSAEALAEVRRRFLEYAENNPEKVNERDKIKLATDDWYLKRYLLARNRRVKDTLDMLMKTMEWRNEFGVHISEDAMFPSEFYKIGALFPYENDKKGNLVLFLRIKYHRKIVEMVDVEKHFLVHTFEKIDRITNGQGLVIIFDCQGAGYANCDVDFLQFLITCATEHAPVGLKYIIVYKLPWVMNAFWSLARKLLPAYLANRVRFCDENTIRDFIEPQNLPDFMNGYCKRNYRWIPPGCPSVFKLANAHGITDAEIAKILPQFQSLLDEADEALANSTYEEPPESITKYVNNPVTAPTLLSDLALCHVGFGSQAQLRHSESQDGESNISGAMRRTSSRMSPSDATSTIRIFPDEFIEFNYDAYNDTFHATLTILNPSDKNSLAFKLMSNRPSNYSVKPARGVLSPNNSLTLSIVLLNEHKTSDKFLIVAQPIEGEIKSISRAQFESLWSSNTSTTSCNNTQAIANSHAAIKLGSYLRKIVTTPAIPSAIRNPQVYELVSTCRSLKRRQSLSIIINIILLIIVVNLLFFN